VDSSIQGRVRDRILISLNEQLPVAKLQASFLEAWMPRDAAIALIAFLSTLAMTLIGWLWEIATAAPESTPHPIHNEPQWRSQLGQSEQDELWNWQPATQIC
jgi:hypothetical protein